MSWIWSNDWVRTCSFVEITYFSIFHKTGEYMLFWSIDPRTQASHGFLLLWWIAISIRCWQWLKCLGRCGGLWGRRAGVIGIHCLHFCKKMFFSDSPHSLKTVSVSTPLEWASCMMQSGKSEYKYLLRQKQKKAPSTLQKQPYSHMRMVTQS